MNDVFEMQIIVYQSKETDENPKLSDLKVQLFPPLHNTFVVTNNLETHAHSTTCHTYSTTSHAHSTTCH